MEGKTTGDRPARGACRQAYGKAPLRSGGRLRVGFCCSLGCRQNEMAGWGTWHARHVLFVAYTYVSIAQQLRCSCDRRPAC